ncbi:transposase [Porphyromonas sp.]|uniref:transposase n=1 Tax=Porphyromonas sp. TaxID=1924944 RepID=UPI0039C70816
MDILKQYTPISNGLVEEVNDKIKGLKRIALGYRDKGHFQLILFALRSRHHTESRMNHKRVIFARRV